MDVCILVGLAKFPKKTRLADSHETRLYRGLVMKRLTVQAQKVDAGSIRILLEPPVAVYHILPVCMVGLFFSVWSQFFGLLIVETMPCFKCCLVVSPDIHSASMEVDCPVHGIWQSSYGWNMAQATRHNSHQNTICKCQWISHRIHGLVFFNLHLVGVLKVNYMVQ